MEKTTTLQEHLEKYLRLEGLYQVIPEHRRRSLFTIPIAFLWMAGAWALAAYFVLRHTGFSGLIVAVLGPPLMLGSVLLVLAVIFVVRQFRLGKEVTETDAGMIGGFLLSGFPVLISIALGIYLRSWSVAIGYIAVYAMGMPIVIVLQQQAYRVHLLIELVRSIFKALWRSVTLLLVLIPLLLVVVLLSVFSQELWEALGSLSLSRLLGSTICLVLLAFIFVLASLEREAEAIVGEFPERKQIVKVAENTLFIKGRLDRGLISEEEWKGLTSELEWRDTVKLADGILPILRSRVKRWLALLLGLTSSTLVVSFFVYFYIFFSVLLSPSLVARWTDMQLDTLMVPISIFQYSWRIGFPTTAVAVAKVSFVLAVFIAVMSSVYALTDETIKTVFTEWLNRKAASWLSASSLYLCVMSPNYQVWEYVVRDKRKGIANVSIVIPKDLPEEKVQEACEHIESRLEDYNNLVLVTAFEQNFERPVYKSGIPGKRWRLLHNKVKDIRTFEPFHLILDELRYQHFLGRDSLDEGVEIPAEWFGNTPKAKALGKAVWEADADHEWVLHPYVFESDTILSFEICLTKRKTKSGQYREYVRELLTMARQMAPDAQNVWIEVCFRDTLDTLTRLNWSNQLPYFEYKDEVNGKNKLEKPDCWE